MQASSVVSSLDVFRRSSFASSSRHVVRTDSLSWSQMLNLFERESGNIVPAGHRYSRLLVASPRTISSASVWQVGAPQEPQSRPGNRAVSSSTVAHHFQAFLECIAQTEDRFILHIVRPSTCFSSSGLSAIDGFWTPADILSDALSWSWPCMRSPR